MGDLPKRFLDKIEMTPLCWYWKAAKDTSGYGRIVWQGRVRPAHRIVYEIVREVVVPADLVMDHLCELRACVRPSHLEPVPTGINTRLRGRKTPQMLRTHCPLGHPYSGDNLRLLPGGRGRKCRKCAAAATRRYLAKKQAA